MAMTPVQHNPLSLAEQYLGPRLPGGIDRCVVTYSENLTASHVPHHVFRQAPLNGKVEDWRERRPVDNALWVDLRPDLGYHIDNRIQLLFQQFLLVYRTRLVFAFYNSADYQVGGKDMPAGEEGSYVAAHSATLPTLRLSQRGVTDTSISFARGSHFYYGWNLTVYLPETANKIDLQIDTSTPIDPTMTLRQRTCVLLNEVAAGDKNPMQGLHDFLQTLVQTVAALRKSRVTTDEQFVLDAYLEVAQAHWDLITSDFPLAQRLCCQKSETIDEQFYRSVQSQMHQVFHTEMLTYRPTPVMMPTIPPTLSWNALRKAIREKTETGAVLPTVKSMEYKKVCLGSDHVRSAALEFLIALDTMSPPLQQEALSSIVWHLQAQRLMAEAKKVILQINKVSAPQNMQYVLLALLFDIIAEEETKAVVEVVEPPAPEVLVPTLKELKAKLQTLAQATTLTKTAKPYLTMCLQSQKVRQVAEKYLRHLSTLAQSEQDLEIRQISLATHESKKSGFTALFREMYEAASDRIFEAKKTRPASTMPATLIHLFADVIKQMHSA